MAAATSKKKTKTAARPAPHKKAEARPAAKEKDKAARPVAKVASKVIDAISPREGDEDQVPEVPAAVRNKSANGRGSAASRSR